MKIMRMAAAGLLVMLCAACGGGGSGGSGTPSGSISITPATSSLTENLLAGMSVNLLVGATTQVTGTISGTVYVVVTDNAGVLVPSSVKVNSFSSTSYSLAMTTSPNLSVGDHKGSLTVQACGDLHCSTSYGSTVLQYDFKVSATSNLKTLSSLSGASDWQTYDGNAARTSFEAVTLNAAAFTPRWLVAIPSTTVPVFVPNGYLDVTTDSAKGLGYVAAGSSLLALKELDGSTAWSQSVNPAPPSVYNDVVYTTQGPTDGTSVAYARYDAATGTALTDADYTTNCFRCTASPVTIVGSKAFVGPGNNGEGSWSVFDAGTGKFLSFGSLQMPDWQTMAFDSLDVYIGGSYGLSAADQATGAYQFSVGVNFGSVVTVDGAGGVLTGSPQGIAHINLAAKAADWQGTSGNGNAQSVAIANGVVYAGFGSPGKSAQASVTVYSLSNGNQLWSWTPPVGDSSTGVESVLLTNNLLFVSTDQQTYAVDVATHGVVWSYPLGGMLSLSPSGILYISASGVVAAVNLQ